MKKLVFAMLCAFIMATITATGLMGLGSAYLIRREIMWMDDHEVQALQEQEEAYYRRMKSLDDELGIELRYLSEDAEAQALNREGLTMFQCAGKLLKFALDDSWDAADEYAKYCQMRYRIYLAQGRPIGGNLPVTELYKAVAVTMYHYDQQTGQSEKYKVYVLMDESDETISDGKITMDGDYQVQLFCISHRYWILAGFFAFALLSVLLILIACHLLKKREEVQKTTLDQIPLDLFLAVGGYGAYCLIRNLTSIISVSWNELWSFAPRWFGLLGLLLFMGFFTIWRMKRKKWYQGTVVLWMVPVVKKFIGLWIDAFRNLSTSWKFMAIEIAITAMEGFLILWFLPYGDNVLNLLIMLVVLKVIVCPFLVRYGIAIGKIQNCTHEVATGKLDAQLEVRELPFALREMGKDVNSMAETISNAVENRLKSERLKTELITNVSHDIKTPLTSIINFSDLIKNEKTENEKITEYAEHLHKQSSRLKKLIEDLMEASKASTGNLEVNLEPCDVKVLLGQCLGEFEPRLQEKKLELVVRQGEETLQIMADNRMLWRVFENLMNNICKYAQSDTRVYLSARKVEENAEITFKNVSKFALDVPPEELMERFVRGDLSRHTEGSGLGLSIVSSLMELQGGKLKLMTDGDLFKAMLVFPLMQDKKE